MGRALKALCFLQLLVAARPLRPALLRGAPALSRIAAPSHGRQQSEQRGLRAVSVADGIQQGSEGKAGAYVWYAVPLGDGGSALAVRLRGARGEQTPRGASGGSWKCHECFVLEMDCSIDALTSDIRGIAECLLGSSLDDLHAPSEEAGPAWPPEGSVIGPRWALPSTWSTNVRDIMAHAGFADVRRAELLRTFTDADGSPVRDAALLAELHDPMTEEAYAADRPPLSHFAAGARPPAPEQRRTAALLPVRRDGASALERFSEERGLGLSGAACAAYASYFSDVLRRDPSDVEVFDMAQSDSEHCRHWVFRGECLVDGDPLRPKGVAAALVVRRSSLLEAVRCALPICESACAAGAALGRGGAAASALAFSDNASSLRLPHACAALAASSSTGPSPFASAAPGAQDLTLTAETHNFPTAVAPFPGAATGIGGRLRDTFAIGRGGTTLAGVAGYAVGRLQLPGGLHPWESLAPPAGAPGVAPALRVLLEGSDGLSRYANCFGEPLVCGFFRAEAWDGADGRRREWVKPILFSAGVGAMAAGLRDKRAPAEGHVVVKIGGPPMRVGVGGGSASSTAQAAGAAAEDAVQRGDPQMGNRAARVVAAAARGDLLASLHDQGAGGNGNVLKELVHPYGADLDYGALAGAAAAAMSPLELWSAEYQENFAALVEEAALPELRRIAAREGCPLTPVGRAAPTGRVRLVDRGDGEGPPRSIVDLPLEDVLGEKPRTHRFARAAAAPGAGGEAGEAGAAGEADVAAALHLVLRHPSVGSKRFLTSKVDRSVGGLVALQPCVGPFQVPLADCGATCVSFDAPSGAVCAVGERPAAEALGASAAASARLSLAEAVLNAAFAPLSTPLRCSVNWMWPPPGGAADGARLAEAALASFGAMAALGVAADGGKDSLSMRAGGVDAPGACVTTVYGAVEDVRAVLTPELKAPGGAGVLLWITATSRHRAGASALQQVLPGAAGAAPPPDVDDPAALEAVFAAAQRLARGALATAGHDVSDGGLAAALAEMAIAGGCGAEVALSSGGAGAAALLFSEEPSVVAEVPRERFEAACREITAVGASFRVLGASRRPEGPWAEAALAVRVDGREVLREPLGALRRSFEATASALEARQVAAGRAEEEDAGLLRAAPPLWRVPFALARRRGAQRLRPPRVAVVRAEGSNGEREMAAAFLAAGAEPWDVTTAEIARGAADLRDFDGAAFVGGFSHGDALGSAVGWALSLCRSARGRGSLEAFRAGGGFSIGVCNGAQLLALLGWVGDGAAPAPARPERAAAAVGEGFRFAENASKRFESRWCMLRVHEDAPAASPWFEGMGGAVLGVWSAHESGRLHHRDAAALGAAAADGAAVPLRYCDDEGAPTEAYPQNPNGSPGGAAALLSADGRHLAVMPHPERCFLDWQQAWAPEDVRRRMAEAGGAAPWLKLFRNALAMAGERGERGERGGAETAAEAGADTGGGAGAAGGEEG